VTEGEDTEVQDTTVEAPEVAESTVGGDGADSEASLEGVRLPKATRSGP
jgi:hypothetical protein